MQAIVHNLSKSEPSVAAPAAEAQVTWNNADRDIYLPKRAWLEQDGSGRPKLSLNLFLSSPPKDRQKSVFDLIDHGFLALDLSLKVPPAFLERGVTARRATPAFVHEASYSLFDQRQTLANARSSGPGAAVALSSQISGDQARSAIAALMGQGSTLQLGIDLWIDDSPQSIEYGLEGAWIDVYDAIKRATRTPEHFELSVLERAVAQLISDRNLVLVPSAPDSDAVVLNMLMASAGMILERSPDGYFRLLERPDPAFGLSQRMVQSKARRRQVRLQSGLDAVIGGALKGLDWAAYVKVYIPSSDGTVIPLPVDHSGVAMRRDAGAALNMVVSGQTMVDVSSLILTQTPKTKPSLAAISQQVFLSDGVLQTLGVETPQGLPVVSDPGEVLFPDRNSANQFWYVPKLELVRPNPSLDPDSSPFRFEIEALGVTQTNQVALRGTVRLTLRQVMSPATRAALEAKAQKLAFPVPLLDLDVQLSLPFIDSNDGSLKRVQLRSQLETQGDLIVASFEVANQWTRLLYGVLSQAGFQGTEQAVLVYSFRYHCYNRTGRENIKAICGSKQALLSQHWDGGKKILSISAAGLGKQNGLQVRLAEEPSIAGGSATGGLIAKLNSILVSKPIATVSNFKPDPIRSNLIQIRPILLEPTPLVERMVYLLQSINVQDHQDVLMPCRDFGSLYLQREAQGWRAIGCQDGLRLGQVPNQRYQELPELGVANSHQVYRNLTQPGRFLILPARYSIARYPKNHARAYQPAAMVYAFLDAQSQNNNRYRFAVNLEPDLQPLTLRRLKAKLGAYAPSYAVQLDLPTEVAQNTSISSLPLATSFSSPSMSVQTHGIQLVIDCPLPEAAILRTALEDLGIVGRLNFDLGESQHLESTIDIHLSRIAGPWQTGALQIEFLETKSRLTNRIDRPLDLSALEWFGASGLLGSLPISRRLEAGESLELERLESGSEYFADYNLPPVTARRSLEESRIFIEDITTNLIFTCGLDFEGRGLADLEVFARLRGVEGEQRVTLNAGNPKVGGVTFTAPLSIAVGAQGLVPEAEFKTVRVMKDGSKVIRDWRPCQGALIDLQWDIVV